MSEREIAKLTAEAVLEIHEQVLLEAGGLSGLSPDKSLDAALFRVENHAFYGGVTSIFEIAALYGIAISRGHVFIDGNKRTALVSMMIFLDLNGYEVFAATNDLVDVMVQVAEKRMDRMELARWLKSHARPHT